MPSKTFNVDLMFSGYSSILYPRIHPTTETAIDGAHRNGQMYFETAVGAKRLWVYDEELANWAKVPRVDYSEGVTGLWTFNRNGAPFAIGEQSATQCVIGLNAEGLADANRVMRYGAATATANTVVIRDAVGRLKCSTPNADDDAANKAYVDSVAQGFIIHQSVKAATTANITLNDEQTVDGVALVEGDRVLVKDQTDKTENGIYLVVNDGDWIRSEDANTWSELYKAYVLINDGSTQYNQGWACTISSSGTLEVNNVTWEVFSKAGQFYAGHGVVKESNTLHAITSSNYTINGVVYASSATALALLSPNDTATRKFLMTVSSGAPAYETIIKGDILTASREVLKDSFADTDTVDFTYTDAPIPSKLMSSSRAEVASFLTVLVYTLYRTFAPLLRRHLLRLPLAV